MIIIIGASGYIGYNLFQRFREKGEQVIGTYSSNYKQGLVHFDLQSSAIDKLIPNPAAVSYLIIAASANVRTDESKKKWDYSHVVNAVKTKEMVQFCFDHKIIPVYLSSDNIFDGEKGNYKEEDPTNAVNCYGQIKQEVEEFIILSLGKPFLILRMGRVFGVELGDNTVLTTTLQSLWKKENLSWINDQFFTPLYINDLYCFMEEAMTKNYQGIFHLASLQKTTRFEIAQAIKSYFELDTEIKSCSVDSLGYLDKRPKQIDLNIEKIKKLTVFKEQEMEHYLKLMKEKNKL